MKKKGEVCQNCGSNADDKNICRPPDTEEKQRKRIGKKEIRRIEDTGSSEEKTKSYKVEKEIGQKTPKIIVNHVSVSDVISGIDLIVDCIKDTERYRIDKILTFINDNNIKPVDFKNSVLFLLNSYELLTADEIAFVINKINEFLDKQDIPHNVSIQLSKELRNIIGKKTIQNFKKNNELVYEELLTKSGIIEVENFV